MMTPMGTHSLLCKDVIEALRPLPPNLFHGCFCDPPYGLKFMGKSWDHGVPGVDYWKEVLRVLKPGAPILAFGGTRTYHRLAVAIEDAGFEIFDSVLGGVWIYGQGFPKSLDIGKAIDKRDPRKDLFRPFAEHYEERRKSSGLSHTEICAAGGFHGQHNHGGASTNWSAGYGVPTLDQWTVLQPLLDLDESFLPLIEREEAERQKIGERRGSKLAVAPGANTERPQLSLDVTDSASRHARVWDGYGTALKPAWEPVVCARKPLDGTYAANCIEHGVGGLNIDGGRIGNDEITTHSRGKNQAFPKRPTETTVEESGRTARQDLISTDIRHGRYPSNLILSHHPECEDSAPCHPDCPVSQLDQQSGTLKSPTPYVRSGGSNSQGVYQPIRSRDGEINASYGDSGGASRFFYQAKCSPTERKAGLPPETTNTHPTLKPLALTTYLARLILPPLAASLSSRPPTLLVPFCGTGSEIAGALKAGWSHVVGIDDDPDSIETAKSRIPGLLSR